jgi:hypothetical protein
MQLGHADFLTAFNEQIDVFRSELRRAQRLTDWRHELRGLVNEAVTIIVAELEAGDRMMGGAHVVAFMNSLQRVLRIEPHFMEQNDLALGAAGARRKTWEAVDAKLSRLEQRLGSGRWTPIVRQVLADFLTRAHEAFVTDVNSQSYRGYSQVVGQSKDDLAYGRLMGDALCDEVAAAAKRRRKDFVIDALRMLILLRIEEKPAPALLEDRHASG